MINLELSEQNIKRCTSCGRLIDKPTKKKLIHWPNEAYRKKTVRLITGEDVETFSFWDYTCRWCAGVETKKKRRITTASTPNRGKEKKKGTFNEEELE